ncbi:putative bifunctional diguanylate cyclase/phosphodiesterase [Planctobacterium marinum]|uniref:putative bifunctional diguanylate cyclase/phosphodiesterase n=1 Tax=Planctobacterium marinum TaxID=1631968 RepID=UPI001E53AF20|nr:EAL domain-containing protein [Planctobacterium marinum]MCC2607535.1 EAL domain-containing protein [Planctobacterium marinum]
MVFSLLKVITAVLLLTAIAIMYVLASTLSTHAKKQLQSDLQLVQSVIEQVVQREQKSLFTSASVLSKDFGFRRAVATKDAPTIASVLQNHGSRVNADLALLMQLDGVLLASSKTEHLSDGSFNNPSLLQEAIANRGASAYIVFEENLYLAFLMPVMAPTPVAVTLFGVKLEQGFLKELQTLAQLQLSMTVQSDTHQQLYFQTDQNQQDCISQAALTLSSTLFYSAGATCISTSFELSNSHGTQITVSVYDQLSKLFADFFKLQWSVIVTIALAIGASLFLTAWLTRKITAPLSVLANKAQIVSGGDYSELVLQQVHSREVEELHQSFNNMISAVQKREAQIRHQAEHDNLTHAFNRMKIAELYEGRAQNGEVFSVIAVNLIDLRSINDVFGYHVGDYVIKTMAERMMAFEGEVARLDGGTFLWLAPDAQTMSALDELKSTLEDAPVYNDVTVPIKISMAHLRCPDDSQNFNSLIKRINMVLDEARATDVPILIFHPDVEQQYSRKLQIVTQLKRALADPDKEFKMVYQPKFETTTQTVTGAEALIRWINPELGFVPPDEFIGIAEQAGLIFDITDWVVKRVAKDCKTLWQADIPITVAVNLSTRDIMREEINQLILAALAQRHLPVEAFSLEVTESDLVSNQEKATSNLRMLRESGFSVAIDDFGTGYSSLSYLKNLPINILKIDKSFVLHLADNEEDQSIVQTTLLLAKNLGLDVVAEGIEDAASLKLLTDWGCRWCQGYYISKPVDLADFINWFKERQQDD